MINIHKSNGGFTFWDTQKEIIINRYEIKKETSNKIAVDYNCSGKTIRTHLKRWGIILRTERYNAKYNIDESVFDDINNEYKAYFFGLLYADGHLSKQGVLMLTLQDLDIMYEYKKFLQTNCPIKKDKYGNYALNIKSKKIEKALLDKGFNNRKSYSADFSKIISNVPDSLISHFIRGLFDGDGSLKIYYYPYLKNPQYHLGYTGILDVVTYFKDYFKINRKLIKESDFIYTCVTRDKHQIKNICDILYKDAHVYIQRKNIIYKQINKDLQRL